MIKSHFFILVFVCLSTCLFADKKVGEGRPNVLLISIDDLNDWISCLCGHPQCSGQEPKAGAAVPGVECSKPNIVIIFTDDQSYADLGYYGNQKNKTPHMDQLAKVREFDRQVGDTVEVLKKTKQFDHTMLIVLDENGAGMPGGKWTVFDWGVRSACVIKCPDSWEANFETDAIAQYCDIVPTLVDAVGGTPSADLDGISLMPLIKGETRTHRDRAYFLFNNRVKEGKPDTHFSIRAVTDGKYKFIWNLTPHNLYSVNATTCDLTGEARKTDFGLIYPSMIDRMETDPHAQAMVDRIRSRPQHQLYDLTVDPYELHNLAGKPEHSQRVKQFKADLRKWMKDQGDDGHLNPQGMQVIKYQGYVFPYPEKGKAKDRSIPQKRKI